jgi:glycosyltransferase involved in cell wall biosynthesis
MPKIIRIINRFNLGGPTYNVAYLTKYLSPNYDTILVGGPEEESEGSSLHITSSLGINPIIIKALCREISPMNDYKAYKQLRQLIRKHRPDIVHTHASKAGALGRLAAIHEGVPVIVHTFHGHVFHSYFGTVKTAFYKWIERRLAKKTSAIVAISQLQKEELTKQFEICSTSQTVVIPLGFDLSRFSRDIPQKRADFRKRYLLEEDELAIGIIGRLTAIKNHRLFIDAFIHTQKNTSTKIRAFIIGDGELKHDIQSYIQSKKISFSEIDTKPEIIQFIGWQTQVDWVLAGLDLVCLSSKNEGTPVSLIEAQAAGKYILTTKVGGVDDILEVNGGISIPPDKENDFCQALLNIVSNFEVKSANAGQNQAGIQEKFSYQRLVKDMDNLYKHLLKK